MLRLMKPIRPSAELHNLPSAVPYMDDKLDTGVDLYTSFEHLMLVNDLNHIIQVNGCEKSGDWKELDSGTFDYAIGTTGKRV